MQTKFKLLIGIVFFFVSHWQPTNAQKECNNPTKREIFEKLPGGPLIGTHVIGTPVAKAKILGTPLAISCGKYVNTKTSDRNVYDDTLSYVVNNTKVSIKSKKVFGSDGRMTLTPVDLPIVIHVSVVQQPNGVYIGYFCIQNDNEQVTMIGYKPDEKGNLDKEADKVAATFTSSPEQHTVYHDKCD